MSTTTGITTQGTITALDGAVAVPTLNSGSAVVQITGDPWSALLAFEGTVNGSDWFAIYGTPVGGAAAASTAIANGRWLVATAGFSQIRVRAATYGSGTVTATIHVSVAAAGGSSGSGTLDLVLPDGTTCQAQADWQRRLLASDERLYGLLERVIRQHEGILEVLTNRVTDGTTSKPFQVDLLSDVVGSCITGALSAIGATALQLTKREFKCQKGIAVIADSANTGKLYLGFSDAVTANTADLTDGLQIDAGGARSIPIDDPRKIWLIASAVSQKAFWLAA